MIALTDTGYQVGEFFARYAHYLAGITWIGLLYYFNFVQTPAFNEFEAAARTEAIAKLVPRALWWFRWGAALTVLSGFFILGFQRNYTGDYFKTPQGISIATGVLFGLTMLVNVWAVIWRNQKIVIANAKGVQAGQQPDPAAAPAARKGAIASRTNTVLSIPLLFFMAFTSHAAGLVGHYYRGSNGQPGFFPTGAHRLMYWVPVLVVWLLVELNGLGLLRGAGPGPHTKYLDTHKNAIITGFVLAAAFGLLFFVSFR